MIQLLSSRLSIRQTVYILSVVVVLTTAFALIDFMLAYRAERQRLVTFAEEVIGSVENIAARAAFHVDDIQAAASLDGVMRFEQIVFARISTDIGVVLAERRRKTPAHFTDVLTRWMFGDATLRRKELHISRDSIGQKREGRFYATGANIPLGFMELEIGPELVGQAFLSTLVGLAGVLVIEFLILGVALAFVLHRTLTRPLLQYAHDIASIDPETAQSVEIAIPPAHANDELGLVVARTNRLFRRIDEQREALLHREKIAALGAMLAGVAHELNNPLAILTAQAELLEETASDQRTKERARKILAPAERCARIIRTFLALARHREIEKSSIVVGEMIDEIVEIMEYQLHADGISLDISVEDGLPRVWGDNSQLNQVLVNIVVNAQQALSAADGERRIRVSANHVPERDIIEIAIADTGSGVPGPIRERIFEPFFTTKTESEGTGLGLSYCMTVARSHGGTVRIDDAPSGGTRIILELPTGSESGPETAATYDGRSQ